MSANFYYLQPHQCSAFIVVLPIGAAFDDTKVHIRIETALAERFAPYKFAVTNEAPYRCDSFTLVPLLGTRADGKPLFDEPDASILQEIGVFLHEALSDLANAPRKSVLH